MYLLNFDEIVLMFDNDSAGQEAVQSVPIYSHLGVYLSPLLLVDTKMHQRHYKPEMQKRYAKPSTRWLLTNLKQSSMAVISLTWSLHLYMVVMLSIPILTLIASLVALERVNYVYSQRDLEQAKDSAVKLRFH